MSHLYLPGTGVAVLTRDLAVLIPGGDRAIARSIHEAVAAGAGAAQVLQVIASGGAHGFGDWPAFAVVAWREAGAQVFVRGELTVCAEAGAGAVTIDGAEVTTWREQSVAGATRCAVGPVVDAVADGLPVDGGVVLADAIVVTAPGGDAPVAARGGRVEATPVPVPGPPVVAGAEPPAPESTAAEPIPPEPSVAGPTPDPTPEPAPGPTAAEVTLAAPEPGAAGHGQPLIADVPGMGVTASTLGAYTASTVADLPGSDPEVRPPEPTVPPAEEPGYDHLWGVTRKGRVEDAAVRAEEPVDESPHARGRGAVPPSPSTPVGTDDPLHDGMTIGPAALAALRRTRSEQGAASPAPAAGHGGHGVLARVCLSGHANPPERDACWVCGRAVAGDASRRARPALGRVRVATGEVVDLDGPFVVGRRPKVTRVQGEVPRVIAVPSPEGEVSASHLAIRLEDWHVLAEDQSRNGTILYRDGDEPRRLQPGIPMIMRSGDVLDLGDGAVLTFEGLP